jgi:hypothetical protein
MHLIREIATVKVCVEENPGMRLCLLLEITKNRGIGANSARRSAMLCAAEAQK